MKFFKNSAIQFRFFLQILLIGFLLFSGVFFCSGGTGAGGIAGGGSPNADPGAITGVATGQGNAASPQTPPTTVSLDPGCEKGAKPNETCKGEPLPPPLRPCPSNLTVIKDIDAGVWWCGCPADTREVKDPENNNYRTCICPSGQSLLVNIDKGESLGCPLVNNRPSEPDAARAPCRSGLVLLMPVAEGHVNFCGCPEGTDHIYPAGGGSSIGCRCPSGSTVQVDPVTSEMVGACPPVELNNDRENECRSPCTLINLGGVGLGKKSFCSCPGDFRKSLHLE